ncbi:MAG: beta-lactamase family protein [Bacteroidales bacterium]|nr:beta-lactamase family protein [Candidatus Cacconaster merdequi]
MKRILLSLSLAAAIVLSAGLSYAQNIPEGFDEYCRKTFDEWNLPAMSVVVVKDGEVVYLKGFGLTNYDGTGKPVDPVTTQFVLASTSKAFTGALLATVIDEYDVKWNDLVTKHLPDFKLYDDWATEHITVQEVNTHHTGFKTYSLDEMPFFGYDRDDLYRLFAVLKPTYPFRSKYAYNNETYTISAKIIEKYTGKSWDDAMAERIFKPLAMVHSTTGNKDRAFFTSENLAYGHKVVYDVQGDSLKIVPRLDRNEGYIWLSAVAPAAFVMTTASDMGNWLKMHLNHGVFEGDTVITRKNHDMLFYPQTITDFNSEKVCTYGQGWFVEQTSRCRLIRHTGLAYGYTSFVGFVPDLNMGIALLTTNGASSAAQSGIARKLIDMYYGVMDGTDYAHESLESFIESSKPGPKKEKPVEEFVAPLKNKAYTGVYKKEVVGDATVYEKDGQLMFHLNTLDAPLNHKNGNKFSIFVPGSGNFDVVFTVKRGKARTLELTTGDPFGEFVRK